MYLVYHASFALYVLVNILSVITAVCSKKFTEIAFMPKINF